MVLGAAITALGLAGIYKAIELNAPNLSGPLLAYGFLGAFLGAAIFKYGLNPPVTPASVGWGPPNLRMHVKVKAIRR